MGNYQLIKDNTLLNQGDRIRRPLGNGKYDEMIVGEYLYDLDAKYPSGQVHLLIDFPPMWQ